MATKKTAGKTSKKATLDFNFNLDNKPSKRKQNKAKKQLKKLSVGAVLIAVFMLALGAVGGFFTIKVLSKNDCFILNGKDEITLQIGEKYTDEGAKVIAFGKEDSSKIKIETNLIKNEDGTYSANEEGTYYMIYTVDDFKYGSLFKIQKIRLINFVEPSEDTLGGNA